VQDYDERFPGAAAPGPDWSPYGGTIYIQPPEAVQPVSPASPRWVMWTNIIQPYVKNWSVLKCPSTTDLSVYPSNITFNPKYSFSYSYNGLLTCYSLAGVAAPAKLFM